MIPRERTSIPPPIENIRTRRSSLPGDSARRLPHRGHRTGKALSGQSENLQRLVDSLGVLAKSGVDALPETVSLLQNSNAVLRTQSVQKDEILSWSRDLDVLAETSSRPIPTSVGFWRTVGRRPPNCPS